jgi:hypothetical protein
MNDLIALYKEHNFDLQIDEERIIARCDRPAPRARLGYKNEFHYRYRTVERMYEACQEFIENHVKRLQWREEEKARKKVQAVAMAANVKVGDIFIDSWGWEQTNVDFYQVVAKPSAKTIVVREIACETVEGSEGMMCRNVRAVPDAFIGEEMKKRIDNYGGFKTSSFSSARPTTAEKEHYNSWYY